MITGGPGRTAVLAALLVLGVGTAGTPVSPGARLLHTLCALRQNYRTQDGERPSLSPFDRVVVALIVSDARLSRPEMNKHR